MSKNDRENARIAKTAIANIFDNDDLQEVYDLLKQRWNLNTQRQVDKYKIGDHVVVTFSSGKLYPAIVTKVNKKTVGVELTAKHYEGHKYNVSPKWLNHN
jgi:16S rRNA U1498 N3-methylase RsmE